MRFSLAKSTGYKATLASWAARNTCANGQIGGTVWGSGQLMDIYVSSKSPL